MQLKLRCKSPSKYPKQSQFLDFIKDVQPGTKVDAHFVGGRGCAKSTTLILVALYLGLFYCPGLPGIITEPVYPRLDDVIIREWKNIVPSELYKINYSKMYITLINGTIIDLRSRNVDNKSKEVSKGPNYAWALEDEQAYKCDLKKWDDVDAAIRHPKAPFLFHGSFSTPKMNDYHKLCHRDGAQLVHATSFDNPFLPENFASDLESKLSAEYASQEIYGKWINMSGRIWKHWDAKLNRCDDAFDFNRPWELWCDLGINSAWIAVQKNSKGKIAAHHEWTPSDEGAEQTLTRIDAIMLRAPKRVVVGHDINTRSIVDAQKPSVPFRRLWGAMPEIRAVSGFIADKQLQHMQGSASICTVHGERMFVIADDFESHDSDRARTKGRGLRELFEQDSWNETPKTGEFLPKDGRLEHMRDAWMYGIIVNNPPRFNKSNQRAR